MMNFMEDRNWFTRMRTQHDQQENTSSFFSIIFIVLLISVTVLISEMYFYNERLSEVLWYFYYLKGALKTSIYVISYLSCVAFIVGVFFIRSTMLYSILFILLCFSYFATTSYLLVNGYGFGVVELQAFIQESGKFSTDVWNAYGSYITKSIIILVTILSIGSVFRYFIRKKSYLIKSRYILFIGLISFILTLGITIKTANTHNKFPVFTNFYNTIIYYISNSKYYGRRTELSVKPTAECQYNNILWILDESISDKYLSINGYSKVTTPYLKSIKDKYINLGRASSIANCSAMTNIGLMSGIQIDQLPDKKNYSLKTPSIFQYAKNAGYTTHYISGQSHDDLLQNYMTKFDLESIDEFYQPSTDFKEQFIPERDIIEKTKSALEQNQKNFFFIVKRGAHFHWAGQAPENRIFFRPRLKKSDGLIIENKEKAINSYINTVKYRVDYFFEEFLKQTKLLDSDDSLIIYTSDHGQSILEGSSHGTHCDSTNPNVNQGTVPLLIFAKKHKNEFSVIAKNTSSHFEIFPTTLNFMGYKDYKNGSTFFNKKDGKQVFSSGDLFGRASFQLNDISKPGGEEK